MTGSTGAAAFYARRGGRAADWWTVLHPPYTLWHVSYVVLGAAMAPGRDWAALGLSVLGFFLAVGVAAHALDELTGRPLGTSISDGALKAAAVLALLGAIGLGIVGIFWKGGFNVGLLVAIPVGVLLVVGYNLELFGGRLHNDLTFGLAWGGFPVAVGYLAQSPPFHADLLAALAATAAGVGTSYAQRYLSTPARRLRRHTLEVSGTMVADDGSSTALDQAVLLRPLEQALRALSWAVPVLAVGAWLAGV
jgi:hypothetical protein